MTLEEQNKNLHLLLNQWQEKEEEYRKEIKDLKREINKLKK